MKRGPKPQCEIVPKECGTCKNLFSKPLYLSSTRWKNARFCSKKCSSISQSKKVTIKCELCGMEKESKQYINNISKRRFCSKKCHDEYVRTKLPFWEQNSYKGVRKIGESKWCYDQVYRKNNKERMKHLKQRRYARKRNAEGSHSMDQWEQMKKEFNYKCAHCKESKPLTKDHIIPLSKGGSDYISNIQPLCRNCNSKKWAHMPNLTKNINNGF